ncbi:hypothetical protein GCK72_017508 [Caenorhabditis remanei]|uniref:Uncharacterized protein n=1 Tax=Caenorhabditis remanei TaxID=31234 RepID=A0A6A5G7H6_CAERE|nr:hypothetical protein GCK72_017508 [Caenorhabditis remanei]KAF1750957.1 hypothetical protein GCK72_017508 [Caenorhabditis remanei]
MLTFASSSSSDLFLSMPNSHFDIVKPFCCINEKKMICSDYCTTSSDDASTSSEFADDSGFFDDSETDDYITKTAYEIGTKLVAMCDDFDAQMMSYSRTVPSRSILSRVFDFFAF